MPPLPVGSDGARRFSGPRVPRLLGLALTGLALAVPLPAAAQAPDTEILIGRLLGTGAGLSATDWRNVTHRPGYDNQPSFTPDSRAMLYTARLEGQTEIFRYDLESEGTTRLTHTPESEYSPTVMPGGARFSAVRVEADSTQRLWSFSLDGTGPHLVLEEVAPVGYHAWLDAATVALFVLGRPSTLAIANVETGAMVTRAHDIGRSLHRVPGRTAVSFLHRDGGIGRIRALDPHTGGARDLAVPLEGSQDYTWTPDGVLLMGSGSRLYALDPLTDSVWREIADLAAEGVETITRIAVSPDGRSVAIVTTTPGSPEGP